MKRGEAGYTLTEMLVVIGIIGVLVAVLTPALAGQLARSRVKAASLQLQTVVSAVESFKSDVGRLPTADEGLTALVEEPKASEGWIGPYLRDRAALNDPWGSPLLYKPTAAQGTAEVVSYGGDRKAGGRGVDADLTRSVQ